jgi:bacteriophage N4 adsorption protein B
MIDHWVATLLAPLAVWVLINGIDDIFIDIAGLIAYFTRTIPSEQEIDSIPQRRTAIFVALWREYSVIQRMIDNNVTRLNYGPVDFFFGAYPNDRLTIESIQEAMKRYPNVHLSLTPHDGPSSKADNLNWIFQRMLLYEQEHGVQFEMILTHDAEDLIDPDALRWINYYAESHDMVQIPVLALPTAIEEITHGIYCDEFAEFQFKDMPARQLLGGFIPSNGVGTGFSRRALDKIAETYSNRIFEPACITEDYENGFRIRRLGFRQKFVPITFHYGRPMATREYFPRKFFFAIKQRTRWITGITLQSWEYHSARETLAHLYWFWRDRKGLVGNLVTPAANLLFIMGASTWTWAHATHHAWLLAREMSRFSTIYALGIVIQAIQTSIRMACSARIYGRRFAFGVPIRVIAANIINCVATSRAIATYMNARLHGRPLRWVKTEHAYPDRAALMQERESLRDVLVGSQWISAEAMDAALASRPEHRRLEEHLLLLGAITEDDLYAALSLQNDLPLGKPEPDSVSVPVTRSLPAEVARKWRVLPFRIAGGELYLASSEVPDERIHRELREYSSLEVRFHLVTPTEFEELAATYLA